MTGKLGLILSKLSLRSLPIWRMTNRCFLRLMLRQMKKVICNTPSSWEYVDSIVKSGIETELILDSISGAVGREAAVGIFEFQESYERSTRLKQYT